MARLLAAALLALRLRGADTNECTAAPCGAGATCADTVAPGQPINFASSSVATSSSFGWNGDPANVMDGETNNGVYVDSPDNTCAHMCAISHSP